MTMNGNCNHFLEDTSSWKESYDNSIKNRRHLFANKGLYS